MGKKNSRGISYDRRIKVFWSKDNYPNSMKNLEEATRNKAIEIANSLLNDDYDEFRSVAVAILQAKQWAAKKNTTIK